MAIKYRVEAKPIISESGKVLNTMLFRYVQACSTCDKLPKILLTGQRSR